MSHGQSPGNPKWVSDKQATRGAGQRDYRDRTEMISPMKPRTKGPKDKSALTLKDPLVMEEIKVQTRRENGQQQGGHPIVKPGESRNTERAMTTKDPPLSRQRSPRISAKANKQDCHSDFEYIKQGKADKQEGHTNTKPIKQDNSKKQDTNEQQETSA